MHEGTSKGRGVSRRSFLKTSAAVGLGVVASPAIVSKAFSSSGEINFMGWSGYDFSKLFEGFTAKTGIKVNFLEQPDQDSMLAQCKLSLQTGAVDFVEPTVDRVPAWVDNGVIQPWDETKVKIDNYDQAFVTGAAGDMAKVDGKRYFIPSVWGTEALTFNADENPMKYGTASLADLFDPKFEGKVTVRGHSSLAAMGRVLDSQGKLPKPWIDGYKDEASFRQLWDIALAEAIKHKANIVLLERRERCAGSLQDQWLHAGPDLGLDRLQPEIGRSQLRLHRPQGRCLRLASGLLPDEERQERRAVDRVRQLCLDGRRLGRQCQRLQGQSDRQGRHRQDGPEGARILQGGLPWRRPAEALVVARHGRLGDQAARRVCRQVEGGLMPGCRRPCRRLSSR